MTKHHPYNPDDILAIFEFMAAGWTKDALMSIYGLSNSQLTNVILRRVCRSVDIPPALVEEAQRQWRLSHRRHKNSKLTAADVQAIREARAAGVPLSTLARQYNIDPSLVSRIGSGQRGGPVPPTN